MNKNVFFSFISQGSVSEILKKNTFKKVKSYRLIKLTFKSTKSKVITGNKNTLYISKFLGLEGLFIKEKKDTKALGAYICDLVKICFNCSGFFTSDELPRYGIGRKVKKEIFESVGKMNHDGSLLFFFAYDFNTSEKIRKYLEKLFSELELEKLLYPPHPKS